MPKRKKYDKMSISLTGNIPAMLKKSKSVLSERQYRELCRVVNETDGYNEKKGLIKACIQAKNTI